MSQSELEPTSADVSLPEGVIRYMRDGRKRYAPAFRRAVAHECRTSGESVAGIALRYGINANLVRRWMDQYAPTESAMLPVSLSTLQPVSDGRKTNSGSPAGSLVIELPGGTVRIDGPVDQTVLATVIDVLSQR